MSGRSRWGQTPFQKWVWAHCQRGPHARGSRHDHDSTGLTSSRQGETFLEGLRRRLALTGLAVVYVLLAVPTLAMLIALTVSLSTTLLAGLGLVLLLIVVPITQQLANLHRALSGWVLGHKIEHPYRPRRPGGPLAVLKGWANDPARWRDFIWTYAVVCIRWALAWIALVLRLGGDLVRDLPVLVRDHAGRHLRHRLRDLHARHPGGVVSALDRDAGRVRAVVVAGAGADQVVRAARPGAAVAVEGDARASGRRGVGVACRVDRPLGGRAASHRARSARRGAGAAGVARDEPGARARS